jgi:uncharacterized protein YndB with AHSA1/START domain
MTDENTAGDSAQREAAHELVLTRLLDAPPETLFRCWTEAALLERWFAPKPWTVASAELDIRPGGASRIVMRSPDGQEFPSGGVYLEVVPNRRLVFTDAFTAGWVPAEKPFFTAVVTFEREDGRTRYTARARHWTAEDKERHERMGFHAGWNQCAAQLEELARTL